MTSEDDDTNFSSVEMLYECTSDGLSVVFVVEKRNRSSFAFWETILVLLHLLAPVT